MIKYLIDELSALDGARLRGPLGSSPDKRVEHGDPDVHGFLRWRSEVECAQARDNLEMGQRKGETALGNMNSDASY
jgi:hypothetical protein